MIGCYTILGCKTNKNWCGILLAILNLRGSFWFVVILEDHWLLRDTSPRPEEKEKKEHLKRKKEYLGVT